MCVFIDSRDPQTTNYPLIIYQSEALAVNFLLYKLELSFTIFIFFLFSYSSAIKVKQVWLDILP